MRSPLLAQRTGEKAMAGWFGGCNSVRLPWLMDDTQYRWGNNIVNRGGIPQTRPGNALRLICPGGVNFQGLKFFKRNKDDKVISYLVFAVDGLIYAVPFSGDDLPFSGVPDWSIYQVKNISLSPTAKNVYFEVAEKSVQESASGSLKVVPTYTLIMAQDGVSNPVYWDGDTAGTLDPDKSQTPIGSWMKYAGSRLWVATGNRVAASDLLDPLSFKERETGVSRGDFYFDSNVTGLTSSSGDNRESNLVVFTIENTSTLLAGTLDREKWTETANFQTLLFPNIGCVGGRSITSQSGLLYWYSPAGLVSSDSAAAAFLTSQIKVRDIEMAQSKRNFAPDLSGICATAFESYMLVSVPSGDALNAQTMVLDYSVSDELNGSSTPAWNGVWTGFRPVEWASFTLNGARRCFFASVDYQSVDGKSFFHIWEAFQSDREDTYETKDTAGRITVHATPIYCLFETKQYGDGLDLKSMKYAEADLIEMGNGDVTFKVSFAGASGQYIPLMEKKFNATTSDTIGVESVQKLGQEVQGFKPQGRRVTTNEFNVTNVADAGFTVESDYLLGISDKFSLLFEWCGRCGIESARLFYVMYPETSNGAFQKNESEFYNIVDESGKSYRVSKETGKLE